MLLAILEGDKLFRVWLNFATGNAGFIYIIVYGILSEPEEY